FAAATVLLLSVKKRFGISAFALAVLIGFSRIYLHVHYCTDVLAGVAVGIVLGLTAKWLVDKIVSAFSRRRKTGHRKKQKK
ncbi:MAG TPA: phosphatase PAP2 family protein, partial [Clostridiales bacterium]|nr:phosphatase PAP2 family protein [Clostridiales bacterium]